MRKRLCQGSLLLAIVVGTLFAGCASNPPKAECRDMPPGGVMILGDGKLRVCHETPEEVEVPFRR